MKIIITGSLGNIGKPLTKQLVQSGHQVTVISSRAERQKDIEELGAKAAIGSIMDQDFLEETFNGHDAAYLMEAFGREAFFDQNLDIIEAHKVIARNYKAAVTKSAISKVVHLSSIGAHTNTGNGILVFHYEAEKILNELPSGVSIKFLRPVGFFSNLYRSIQNIKSKNAIFQNFGGDKKEPWVSPYDIATAIAEEMQQPFEGRTVRYIASDEVSPNEIAAALGGAIGNPDLQWIQLTDEEMLNGMLAAGMNKQTATGFVAMQAAQRSGLLYEDYYKKPPLLATVKLADFAKEFAEIYQKT
ncbi:NAD(P)H-binding protein [Flavobacterium pallidum]|uniref:NAD-dependent dehydratase n=1 Tax=Flavobacterium pallidum TaxID=2172098 RepID=A0A2S1SIY7_9FLAO|nr:NAD(P)H-binding protein [Flavobacterium pallidum]AWI26319.1 NAD-dependent dehydratase [Flavobacterium pallidum]